MSDPTNASLTAEGFRKYQWTEPGKEPVDVLSVTSIRKLCGQSFVLVNWMIGNLVDSAMGTEMRTIVGPRGGVRNERRKAEFPSEFVQLYLETEGKQEGLDKVRRWLSAQADAPRNIAAARGTIVHKLIELDVPWEKVDRPFVEAQYAGLTKRDRDRISGVQDEDVNFIANSQRNYWDMREAVPFVILAREPQVWNLTAGYAGSGDALLWFLPDGTSLKDVERWQGLADLNIVTLAMIEEVGGYLAVGDWKTSKGVYTDHVIQIMAYGAGEFIGANGTRDARLTEFLRATSRGVLLHIRPDGWAVDFFNFDGPILRAFLGSVAFARFLAKYPEPDALFAQTIKGKATE